MFAFQVIDFLVYLVVVFNQLTRRRLTTISYLLVISESAAQGIQSARAATCACCWPCLGRMSSERLFLGRLLASMACIGFTVRLQYHLAGNPFGRVKQPCLGPISMAGFEVTTYGRFCGDHRG